MRASRGEGQFRTRLGGRVENGVGEGRAGMCGKGREGEQRWARDEQGGKEGHRRAEE